MGTRNLALDSDEHAYLFENLTWLCQRLWCECFLCAHVVWFIADEIKDSQDLHGFRRPACSMQLKFVSAFINFQDVKNVKEGYVDVRELVWNVLICVSVRRKPHARTDGRGLIAERAKMKVQMTPTIVILKVSSVFFYLSIITFASWIMVRCLVRKYIARHNIYK